MLNKLIILVLAIFPVLFFSQAKDSAAFFSDKGIFPYYLPIQPPNPQCDFYAVKKMYRAKIDSLRPVSHFNGIITITFFINYVGRAGFFSMKAIDNNYTPVEIPSDHAHPLWRLSNMILATTQRYFNLWTISVDRNGQPVNIRKFYSFRFNDGVLSDIFPK